MQRIDECARLILGPVGEQKKVGSDDRDRHRSRKARRSDRQRAGCTSCRGEKRA
jgi:hypothetical protein